MKNLGTHFVRDSNSFWKFYVICCCDANSGLRSGKESEAFWWSWIPNDTRGLSRIFCPTPEVQSDHFCITLLSWEFLLNRYNFLWNFCWNREFLLCTTISTELVATKFLAAKLHSLYPEESEILERSDLESAILPLTPQPWMPYLNDCLYWLGQGGAIEFL